MTVTNKSFHHLERQGQSYYFCGTKCKNRFANEASRFTGLSPDPTDTRDGALDGARIAALTAAFKPWMQAHGRSAGLLLLAVLVILGIWLL